MIVKKLRIHVGPEFLDDVGESIEANLRDPALARLGPGALGTGIVEARDACSGTIAHDFREVQSPAALIGASDDKSRERINGAFRKSAAAEGVVAWILVGNRGI